MVCSKYSNEHPLVEEHGAGRERALRVGGMRRTQAGPTVPPVSLGRREQAI